MNYSNLTLQNFFDQQFSDNDDSDEEYLTQTEISRRNKIVESDIYKRSEYAKRKSTINLNVNDLNFNENK